MYKRHTKECALEQPNNWFTPRELRFKTGYRLVTSPMTNLPLDVPKRTIAKFKVLTASVEYSYDDWAVGNLAGALGFEADKEMFLNRSKNYKNVWNNDVQFFCPKTTDGAWNCPDLYTYVFDGRYIEGDAWHWRWFAPHDAEGLISLFESEDYFVEQLQEFFSRSEDDPFNVLPNPYYWAGNEPDIFAVWLFNFAGRPDLTQQYARWNLDNKYSSQPDGLPGNDDYGNNL
jgi:putative alpha-1,2-mannosidase